MWEVWKLFPNRWSTHNPFLWIFETLAGNNLLYKVCVSVLKLLIFVYAYKILQYCTVWKLWSYMVYLYSNLAFCGKYIMILFLLDKLFSVSEVNCCYTVLSCNLFTQSSPYLFISGSRQVYEEGQEEKTVHLRFW